MTLTGHLCGRVQTEHHVLWSLTERRGKDCDGYTRIFFQRRQITHKAKQTDTNKTAALPTRKPSKVSRGLEPGVPCGHHGRRATGPKLCSLVPSDERQPWHRWLSPCSSLCSETRGPWRLSSPGLTPRGGSMVCCHGHSIVEDSGG